jgi:hypothetical protein
MADTPQWRRSSKSGGTNCVEVARSMQHVLMRDSKDPGGPVLAFSPDSWGSFIDFVRDESQRET